MLLKLTKSLREYKKYAIATPILVILEVFIDVLTPFLTAKMIDEGIQTGNMKLVIIYSTYLFIASAFALFFGATSGLTASKASSGFATNLRKDMYSNIQNFSFSNIDKFSTGSIVTRMTTDVNSAQISFQMITRMATRSPVLVIFAFIMSYRISKEIALIYLMIAPVIILIVVLLVVLATPEFRKLFRKLDKLNNVIGENLRGIRTVKAYVREEEETKKFNATSNKIYKIGFKAGVLVSTTAPLMTLAIYACLLTIAWISTKKIVYGDMTLGALTSLIIYTMQILINMMLLFMVIGFITMSRASFERIGEVIQEKSTVTNKENAIKRFESADITFDNVSFKYKKDDETYALSNISFEVKEGETLGVIGGTGSGKSTLTYLIPRLYDTTSGTVKVGGIDVKDYDMQTLRENIAIVLQKNILFSGTIKENIKWGNKHASDELIDRVCDIANASEFISQYPQGYETYIEQGGVNVSGGQKQRLCIARALAKEAKILILDDSTSAVDTKTDAKIKMAFKKELSGITKIIIAQRVSSIAMADKIIVLNHGEIVGMGTHKELMENNEIYNEIYCSQRKGLA